jgi:hypothetical protein
MALLLALLQTSYKRSVDENKTVSTKKYNYFSLSANDWRKKGPYTTYNCSM